MADNTPSISSVINWFEIPCTDLPRAQTFYETVLGCTMYSEDFGGAPMVVFEHQCPATGGCLVGGGAAKPSHDAGVRIYLDCSPSVEAALARVPGAGGQVLDGCIELPKGIGFMAHVRDTEGNTIGLHAMSR